MSSNRFSTMPFWRPDGYSKENPRAPSPKTAPPPSGSHYIRSPTQGPASDGSRAASGQPQHRLPGTVHTSVQHAAPNPTCDGRQYEVYRPVEASQFSPLPLGYGNYLDIPQQYVNQVRAGVGQGFASVPVEQRKDRRFNPVLAPLQQHAEHPGQSINPYLGNLQYAREQRSEYQAWNSSFAPTSVPTQAQAQAQGVQSARAAIHKQQGTQYSRSTRPNQASTAEILSDESQTQHKIPRRAVGTQPEQQTRSDARHHAVPRHQRNMQPHTNTIPPLTCEPIPSRTLAYAHANELPHLEATDPAHLRARDPLYQHPQTTMFRNLRDKVLKLFGRKNMKGSRQLSYRY